MGNDVQELIDMLYNMITEAWGAGMARRGGAFG